jgi:hypothetical protein
MATNNYTTEELRIIGLNRILEDQKDSIYFYNFKEYRNCSIVEQFALNSNILNKLSIEYR